MAWLLDRIFLAVFAFAGWLGKFNAVDVFASCVFIGFWLWVWRKSADPNDSFSLVDAIKDPYTNKAGGAAMVYLGLAGVSAWYVIRVAVDGGDPSNFLLGVLGIFIVKAGADRAIAAWGSRAPPHADGDDDTRTQDQLDKLHLK